MFNKRFIHRNICSKKKPDPASGVANVFLIASSRTVHNNGTVQFTIHSFSLSIQWKMCHKSHICYPKSAILSRLVWGKGQICIPGCALHHKHVISSFGIGSCCWDATLDSEPVDCIIFFAVSDTFSICRAWTGLKRDGYASLCLSVQAVTGSRLTVGLVLHLSHGFESPRSIELEMESQRLQ